MAGEGDAAGKRISLRPSRQLRAHLEHLAELGEYGTNPTEVAENLIREQIVRLIATDFFARARRTKALRARRSRKSSG